MKLGFGHLPSPIGEIEYFFDRDALLALEFDEHGQRTRAWLARRYGDVEYVAEPDRLGIGRRLARYVEGDLAAIDGIPTCGGGTPFQEQVWAALRRIPAGETTSYSALAAVIGRSNAQRAVGAANGANPIAIVVPCHRVIGRGGGLTGYGGGLERKQWLLRHEGAMLC